MNKEEIEHKGEWWTVPAEGLNGGLVMVTCREDVKKFRDNPRYKLFVQIIWKYVPLDNGMPSDSVIEEMAEVQDRLQTEFDKDPVAVLVGVATGEGEKVWYFYTTSNHIFQRKLNEQLADLPLYPLEITCQEDPDWSVYDDLSSVKI